MGGNALKNTVVSRLSLDVYITVKQDLYEVLSAHVSIAFLYDVPGKQEFGDVDILCDYKGDLKALVNDLFAPVEMFVNGNVVSFAYLYGGCNHQVDLIQIDTDLFDAYRFYMSYGDVGNILGKIVKRYDLHFGIQGLFVKHLGKQVVLSADPVVICEYLGLDFTKWSKFQSVEEIFDWIMSCRLFDKSCFWDLNQKDRRHVRDRKMYQDFVAYIDRVDKSGVEGGSLKEYAIEWFGKGADIVAIEEECTRLEERRRKFDSNMFMKHGYSGKELGVVMRDFKMKIEGFDAWVDAHTKEEIAAVVDAFCSVDKTI